MTALFMSAKTINNKKLFHKSQNFKVFFNYHLLIGVKNGILKSSNSPSFGPSRKGFFLPIFKPLLLHKFNSAVPFRLCANSYIIKYIVY